MFFEKRKKPGARSEAPPDPFHTECADLLYTAWENLIPRPALVPMSRTSRARHLAELERRLSGDRARLRRVVEWYAASAHRCEPGQLPDLASVKQFADHFDWVERVMKYYEPDDPTGMHCPRRLFPDERW